MYRSPSFKAYEADPMFKDSLSARQPVKGTVPRGLMTYERCRCTEGYEAAKVNMTMPAMVPTDSLALAEGAKLYGIFCMQCHGEEGAGQGVLVKNEVFLGIPSYADREITAGSIFHVVTYGKGVMGSHA
ncbi:MAG: cytochrome c [Owenweeksia sp.]|nr:cytochrome c [Owenweeksia sp.]